MNKQQLELQTLDWTQAKPLVEPIRRDVFIVEQNIPESEEWDKWDGFSVHVVAIHKGKAVGTGRLTQEGKIGRMATLKAYRNTGIGEAILTVLIRCAEERALLSLSLHAQIHIQHFYAKFGFKPEGEQFEEAGITHILMKKTLSYERN